MAPTILSLRRGFAAEVVGVDAASASAADVAAIKAAMVEYGVLVLRDQRMTEDEQVRFGSMFGPLDTSRVASSNYRRGMREDLAGFSNVDEELGLLPPTDRRRLLDLGNKLWHADSTFKPVPAHLSMLYGVKVTAEGGETQFADLRAGYDALSDDWKRLIEGLVALHSAVHARVLLGFDEWTPEQRRELEKLVAYDIVRTLPDSGRKTLFLSAHASHIVGLPVPVGRMLLHELTELATTQDNVYAHTWRPNDFVIWDNRCTMHRLRRYKASSERRIMRRVTTQDPAFPARDPATVSVPDWVQNDAA
jgi:alpha-ketoglutarate-dependent 2,4-dichlorophenoxyacetate dioxygenase